MNWVAIAVMAASFQPEANDLIVVDQLSEEMIRAAVTANGDEVAAGNYPAFGINAKNGIDYVIKVDGCTSKDRCQGLSMLACWSRDPTVTLDMVNSFNRAAPFGRAVLKETELCFYSYAITNGGVTVRHLKELFSVFNANTLVFVKTMEAQRGKVTAQK